MNAANKNSDKESEKNAFLKDVNDFLEGKNLDAVLDDFQSILGYDEDSESIQKKYFKTGLLNNDQLFLLFLLCLDGISSKLYKRTEEECLLPVIEQELYSNRKDGYFDRLFEISCRLIYRLISKKNWNIIIKMDVHNGPSNWPSIYSLVKTVTKDGKDEIEYRIREEESNSKAYSLFFKYNDFCKNLVEQSKLDKGDVYTIHKDFSDKKTTRAFAYEFRIDENALYRYTDGEATGHNVNYGDDEKGKRYYFDFLKCVLNDDFLNDKESEFSTFIGNNWKQDFTPESFTVLNLGISGFESWGTLMIEAFNPRKINTTENVVIEEEYSAESVANTFFCKEENGEEREDTKLLVKIKNIISVLKKIDDEYNDALSKLKIKKESEKSAKAAIMSRNMSHNLGSHVMAYLKQQLGSVTSILSEQNKVLADLYPNYVKLDGLENVELPFLVGLGKFLGYLQERQDYIATISTDYIPYGAPVNMKDAVYDEINPDLRYMRHKKGQNDTRNKPVNILLSYIAKSENLSRENMDSEFNTKDDIRFGFIDYTDNANKPRTFGFKTFGSGDAALKQMRTINFSLPGGLVGRQAIFSIFENLIRNAAKHGNREGKEGNLDFTLDVIDGAQVKAGKCPAWEKRVCDEKWRERYEQANDIEDLYIFTITDNLKTTDNVVEYLRSGISEPYVDPTTNKMKTANKGIKEIRISAAWMRGETDESLYMDYEGTGKGRLAPLVAVEKSDDGCLRYMVCVRKNKVVAIVKEVKVGDTTYSIDEASLGLFGELSGEDGDCWTILSETELLESKTSFAFILVPDGDEVYNHLRPFTSNRLMCWKPTDESAKALADSHSALMYIYRAFTGINANSEPIYIDDYSMGVNNYDDHSMVVNNYKDKIKDFTAESGNIDFGSTLQPKPIYLYRTHLATERMYVEFIKDPKSHNITFAEGITGDNSSDRLIRREVLDERWYYTHLNALRKRIAIIDERIFRMVHNVEESLVYGVEKEIELMSLQEKLAAGMIDLDIIKELLINANGDRLGLSEDQLENINDACSLDKIAAVVRRCPASIFEQYLDKTYVCVEGNSHLTAYHRGRGVDVFSVAKIDATHEAVLVGCVGSELVRCEGSESDDTYKFIHRFERLATFRNDESGKLSIEVNAHSELFARRYDFVSIHQGILDKVYECLEIKQLAAKKCELTQKLHELLMKDNTVIMGNTVEDTYLPRLIIHSGRAKPTVEDMPQKQPFVQFAAIENAVKDCKLMLVELLDYAKYEQK